MMQVNPYLAWEYCDDPDIQYLDCPAPTPMRNHMPEWFKKLKAKKDDITIAEQQTIRNCLGFRGLANIGYTIPLPETIDGFDTYFSRGRLQPSMIDGTIFGKKGESYVDKSLHLYRIKLLCYPWRAKMTKGWRLLILPYLLDWNNDWNEFAGTVEPNYDVQHGTQIGSSLKWTTPIDTQYNYYNLETVIAYKRSLPKLEKGTLTFCAVPLFDPELLDKQTKGVYNVNMD
jgi:hypothetical protein|tara:strand:+ start:1294 stop:1980 length:687 start_codon:yes stop_codon:yes gene_type:complete